MKQLTTFVAKYNDHWHLPFTKCHQWKRKHSWMAMKLVFPHSSSIWLEMSELNKFEISNELLGHLFPFAFRSLDRLLNAYRYRSKFVQCSIAIYLFQALAFDGRTLVYCVLFYCLIVCRYLLYVWNFIEYRVQISQRSIRWNRKKKHRIMGKRAATQIVVFFWILNEGIWKCVRFTLKFVVLNRYG